MKGFQIHAGFLGLFGFGLSQVVGLLGEGGAEMSHVQQRRNRYVHCCSPKCGVGGQWGGWIMHASICFGSVFFRFFSVWGLFKGSSERIFVWWVWDEFRSFPVMETPVDRMEEEAVANGETLLGTSGDGEGSFFIACVHLI